MSFWEINNISNKEKELIFYGYIVDTRPWYSTEEERYITSDEFLKEYETLKNIDRLTIRINSGGGDVFTAVSIYNLLKSLECHKTVIIDGLCASAATIIAMAGDVIKIPASAFFMIHNPSVYPYSSLDVNDIEKLVNILVKIKESIIGVYKSKVDLSEDELSRMMDNETWLLGNEAVEKGFADELITNEIDFFIENYENQKFLIANSVKTNLLNYKNLPKEISKKPNLTPENKGVEDIVIKNTENEGGKKMTLEEMKKEYPDLVNQIKNEGVIEERQRFKEIEEIGNSLDKTLLNKAKYDEPMDAKTLAFENMKLENKITEQFLKNSKEDSINSGVNLVNTADSSPSNSEKNNNKSQRVSNIANFMNKDKRRTN